MVGTWRINAWIAAGGALLTLLLNISRNPWSVACTRALAAAAAFWLLGYLLRFLLSFTLPDKVIEASPQEETSQTGSRVNLQADSDENLEELLRSGWKPPAVNADLNQQGTQGTESQNSGFQPLSPPQLRAARPDIQEADLVQVVRHLNRQDGQE
ncbi:hypothetical protein [Paenibacillus herberti]|uniref:Uncharacterized protein n=1 Tax=Paenibacillus herberti TaxID=1619309 RepID=A0A229P1M6_9BACL|nr:hypothetical protein [Paenibacillus herberti]OXM16008.1 hypothetical protein CGZ75_04700 [Paenibacillus herberti]